MEFMGWWRRQALLKYLLKQIQVVINAVELNAKCGEWKELTELEGGGGIEKSV